MTTWRAGMRITAGRMYETDLIGRAVFMANRSTVQSIATGAENVANALSWNTIDLDVLGGWNAANPTRWTAPFTGWWTFQGAVSFATSTSGIVREAVWFVNGSLASVGRSRPPQPSALGSGTLSVNARTFPYLLAAGDYVELVPAHNASAALNTATGSYRPYAAITYSGPV